MIKKILSTTVLVALTTSLCLAQVETVSAPGKAHPTTSTVVEPSIVLNSAPVDPTASRILSGIEVEPAAHEAVLSFSTSTETHAVIEYGLTLAYDHSVTTEPQSDHIETLGELLACKKYYYRVHVGNISKEGTFKTLGCVVTKKVVKTANTLTSQAINTKSVTPAPTAEVVEAVPVLNAAPEVVTVNEEVPQAPQPMLISTNTADDISATQPSPTVPVGLIIFALLSGMVVIFFTVKKKKWYQK